MSILQSYVDHIYERLEKRKDPNLDDKSVHNL
jgi:hypothetical protein